MSSSPTHISRPFDDASYAQAALRFLGDVSAIFADWPDVEDAIQRIARLAVPSLCDSCIIAFTDESQGHKHVAVVHYDTGHEDLLRTLFLRGATEYTRDVIETAIKAGQSLLIDEVPKSLIHESAPDQETLAQMQVVGLPRSAIIAPLIARGQNIGAIFFVRSENDQRYTPDDVILVEQLARHIALALDNTRLHAAEHAARRAAEQAAERTARLQNVTAALSGALTPAEVGQVVVEQGIATLSAQASSVSVFTGDPTMLEIIAAGGYLAAVIEQWRFFPLTAPVPLTDAIHTQKAIWLGSRDAWLARYPWPDVGDAPQLEHAWAAIPLIVEGQVLGGLALSFFEEQSFPSEDRTFALTLAQQCAQALERARLYEAEQHARIVAERAAERTARLQSVTAALSGALTPAEVGQVVVEQGAAALGAHAGVIALLNDERTLLKIIASTGYTAAALEGWSRFSVTQSVRLAKAVQSGEPIWLESQDAWRARYSWIMRDDAPQTHRAWATLPLVVDGRVLGSLGLSFTEEQTFPQEDRDFALTLAQQCAQALERARLYEAEQQAHQNAEVTQERLAFLAEASAILASSLDYTSTLDRVVRLTVPRLADWCVVYLIEDDGHIRRVAVAANDARKACILNELEQLYPLTENTNTLFRKIVLQRGESMIVPDITDPAFTQQGLVPDHIELLRSLNGHSNLIVPLTARERVIGGCWFAFGESGRNYTPADLTLVEDLARRIAQAIDNARLHTATQEAERKTGEALALLDTLITTAPNGIAFLNRELRYVRINDALAAINGLPAADHIGHTPSELFPLFGAAFEQQCAQVITTGTPILNVEVIHKLPHDPQHIRHWLTSYYPVRGQDGQILGAGIVVVEITAQKQDEDKLRHYAQRLQAVHAIDQAILEAQPQDVLTKNVLAQLHTLAPYDRASVVMYADTKPTNVITYVVTEDSLRISYTTSSVSAAWAEFIPQLSAGRIIQIGDLQTMTTQSALTQHLLRDGIRRLLSIPMIIDGQLIGSLHIGATTPGAYTEDQIAIAYDIADNLAVGIQQARLREAEQQARQITETIRAANEALSRTLNLHTVLDTLLEYLERLVPYDSANVILIDNQKIIMKAGRGYDSWTNSHAIRPPYDDISGFPLFNAMLTTHQSTLVPDTSACAVWITTPETEQLCSWIGIPLIANDAVIGFYCLGKTRPHFFTQAHVQIAESLAAPAAVAIQNAQLYTNVVESQNRLQTLSRRLAEVQEAERRRIAQELHDQFGQTLTGLQMNGHTAAFFRRRTQHALDGSALHRSGSYSTNPRTVA